MNIEVEVKIKIDDFDSVKKSLPKFGKPIKSINQIDDYYVPSHRDFFARKPFPIEWLRIRTNPDKVIFEYDRSINKDKNGFQDYAEEYETEILNPKELRKILDFLDFKKIITVDKQREYWDCGNFEVALDGVKELGDFIEVEAKYEFKDAKEALNGCLDFLEKLGIPKEFSLKNMINMGYPVLLLKKKEGI